MATQAFIGIDVGTSSIKAIVVSAAGAVLSGGEAPLTVSVPEAGWAEQTPEDWWQGTVSAVNAAVAGLDSSVEIKAISLSGQMHSLVALDRERRVIRPAILWNDVRTSEQCAFIRNRVGDHKLRQLCGNPAVEGFTATKLLWMRQHEPANFERLRKFVLAKDYVRFRMTGELATEPSDASGTLLFDIVRGDWSAEMCALLELDSAILPPLVGSSAIAGTVTADGARQLGVAAGTPVAGGGADNACAATGSGVVSPGTLLVTIGTSGAVVAPISRPATDPAMRIHSMAHAAPALWYLMGVVLSAGAALAWWKNSLAGEANGPGFDELVEAASKVPPGSAGLTLLPYLTGERTPHADAVARGVFAGLHAGHSRAHMTRSVLEGVSFALRDSLELMKPLDVSPESAVAVGGGARSGAWLQIMADILGVPLKTVGPGEGAPLGAAMLAAVGAGSFDTVADAGAAWLTTRGQTDPDPGKAAVYAESYERYRSLYVALREWFAAGVGR
ncbi:MAG: xylulokinase [Chloroflexi bacterium]|nr:xylulokinase [Chloroflexota bacterium]